MTCPGCGSSEIRASHSANWSDVLKRVGGREAFRCRKCRLRFFARKFAAPAAKQESSASSRRAAPLVSTRTKKRLARRMVAVVIFAAALVIFLFFLRYITTERVPAGDSGALGGVFSGLLS